MIFISPMNAAAQILESSYFTFSKKRGNLSTKSQMCWMCGTFEPLGSVVWERMLLWQKRSHGFWSALENFRHFNTVCDPIPETQPVTLLYTEKVILISSVLKHGQVLRVWAHVRWTEKQGKVFCGQTTMFPLVFEEKQILDSLSQIEKNSFYNGVKLHHW